MAETYIDLAAEGPGSVTELAESREQAKYGDLQSQYNFQFITVETLHLINKPACIFKMIWLARTDSINAF